MAIANFKKWDLPKKCTWQSNNKKDYSTYGAHDLTEPWNSHGRNTKQNSPTKINECMWMTPSPSDMLPSLENTLRCNFPLLCVIW